MDVCTFLFAHQPGSFPNQKRLQQDPGQPQTVTLIDIRRVPPDRFDPGEALLALTIDVRASTFVVFPLISIF